MELSMNKIKIVLHCLPNELDQIAWIIDQLKRSSLYVNNSTFVLDFTASISAKAASRLFR